MWLAVSWVLAQDCQYKEYRNVCEMNASIFELHSTLLIKVPGKQFLHLIIHNAKHAVSHEPCNQLHPNLVPKYYMVSTTYAPNLDILQLLAVWTDAVKIYHFFLPYQLHGKQGKAVLLLSG